MELVLCDPAARIGLGRIVALYFHPSALDHMH